MRLQQAVNLAVTTILAIMLDKDTPARLRVQAADWVLEYSANCELQELETVIDDAENPGQARRVNPDAGHTCRGGNEESK